MIVDSKGKMVETDLLILSWQMKLGQEKVRRQFRIGIAVGISVIVIASIIATGLFLNWLTGSSGF